MARITNKSHVGLGAHYDSLLGDIAGVIDAASRSAARSVNSIMTAACWMVGRRTVESEQKGEKRAAYGEELLKRLSVDLRQRFGRGFGVDNLQRFRAFYLEYPSDPIYATPSLISQNQSIAKPQGSILPAASAESVLPGTLELP